MSDWQEGANKRRDARHTKTEIETKSPAGKKDTKRWCGGKVGREHKLECFLKNTWYWRILNEQPRELACSVCGRIIATWFPPLSGWVGFERDKPDWVDK